MRNYFQPRVPKKEKGAKKAPKENTKETPKESTKKHRKKPPTLPSSTTGITKDALASFARYVFLHIRKNKKRKEKKTMIIANENVYHNGVKYPHSEELDGVTFYMNDTYDVVDLAVDSDVETVTFWDPRANGIWRSIFLQDVKTSYPNVKKLIVEAGISGVNMRNALFPNVQEVEVQPKAKAPYMAGGKAKHTASHKNSVLILNGCLLNTFYQSPDSVIDLTGAKSIAPYAFSGCRTNHIVHTNQVRKIEPHAFDGFSFHARFAGHQKIMDTILMEVEPDSEVQVPASVTAVNPDCGLAKARCLICSSFADVSRIRALFPALYRGVRLPKDIVIQKTAFDLKVSRRMLVTLVVS